MPLPEPHAGLVISYTYLWSDEYERGVREGRKDRPCAIVLARRIVRGRSVVTVVPVTHSAPADKNTAIEIPAALKRHLGLDSSRNSSGPVQTCVQSGAANPAALFTACCRQLSSGNYESDSWYSCANAATAACPGVTNERRWHVTSISVPSRMAQRRIAISNFELTQWIGTEVEDGYPVREVDCHRV